jgi:hypothetical protein
MRKPFLACHKAILVWVILNICDILTTCLALSAEGTKEGNPIMHLVHCDTTWEIALFKVLLFWIPAVAFYKLNRLNLLWLCNTVLALICLNNLVVYALSN